MTPAQIRARQIATDVLMENLGDDWSEPSTVTADMVDEAVRRINPDLFTPGKNRRTERARVAKSVREWMGNQAKHDGYVDELAVERAVELRFEAWVALTDVERSVVVGRLAVLSNPWGIEGADVFSSDPSTRHRAESSAGDYPATPRAERFAQWPLVVRDRLRNTVAMRRIRAASAA